MKPRRVVITGLGALTPIGNTLPEYWGGLLSGVSGAGPITHFDASKFKTQFACELKNFDPLNFMDRNGWDYIEIVAVQAGETTTFKYVMQKTKE